MTKKISVTFLFLVLSLLTGYIVDTENYINSRFHVVAFYSFFLVLGWFISSLSYLLFPSKKTRWFFLINPLLFFWLPLIYWNSVEHFLKFSLGFPLDKFSWFKAMMIWLILSFLAINILFRYIFYKLPYMKKESSSLNKSLKIPDRLPGMFGALGFMSIFLMFFFAID